MPPPEAPIDNGPRPPRSITCVVPAYNAARTLARCLQSIADLGNQVDRCLVVDDGSTDQTADIAAAAGCDLIRISNSGAAAARNIGWRAAETELVWFLDADCAARPGCVTPLLAALDDARIAGVGGSFDNAHPDSLLACIFHEEVAVRHLRMPPRVNHLATGHVVYRHAVLAEVGGFDEDARWAHDVELSYRIVAAGYHLAMATESRVTHDHPTRLLPYLKKQAKQGYYRMRLYRLHPERATGDSYVGKLDILRPLLAALSAALAVAATVAIASGSGLIVTIAFVAVTAAMVACSVPMTVAIIRQTGLTVGLSALGVFTLRAYFRAAGMVAGFFTNPFALLTAPFARRMQTPSADRPTEGVP